LIGADSVEPFCDSSGINALVHAQRVATRQSVDLILEPSPAVRRILEIVRLEHEFHTTDPDAPTTH
jgi:anti-anti-sigma regulatory factor